MWRPILIISTVSLSGCAWMGIGRISSNGVTVRGVKDAGSPAVLATSNAGTRVVLPQGSKVVKTEVAAVEAKPAREGVPAVEAQPAKVVTEIIPGGTTEYHETKATVAASSGTVDTSIRKHEIDAAEGRPLLYAAIVSALGAGFFVYRAYPTPAICCGAASVVFFMAWRMSGLPPWFYALGLAAVAGGVMLWLGHKRGLHEPVPTDPKT